MHRMRSWSQRIRSESSLDTKRQPIIYSPYFLGLILSGKPVMSLSFSCGFNRFLPTAFTTTRSFTTQLPTILLNFCTHFFADLSAFLKQNYRCYQPLVPIFHKSNNKNNKYI